jgi:hypothetical protein
MADLDTALTVSRDSSRGAGAPEDEIEVTPEMVKSELPSS